MPRQSRSSRPAAKPSAPSQSRGAHTMAAPPQSYNAPPPAAAQAGAQQRQPGMLGNMVATMGSVAAGSAIGHTVGAGISSMFFGGSSAPAESQAPPVQQQQSQVGRSCDFQAKEFTKCMETGDVHSCGWYLDQLKACQTAAAPY